MARIATRSDLLSAELAECDAIREAMARGSDCWGLVWLGNQVRKVIARMKAKAVITKLEDSIKHDESFVSTVEKKAEKAAGQ